MAIEGNFSITDALNSKTYAYKCWYNYKYGGNTMGISPSDMGEITTTWKSELSSWVATASKDENKYEIDDSDYEAAKKAGKNSAKQATGDKVNKGGMIVRGIADTAAGAAGALLGRTSAKIGAKAAEKVTEGVAKKAAEKGLRKAGEKVTENLTEDVATKAINKGIAQGTAEASVGFVKKAAEKAGAKAGQKALAKGGEKAAEKATDAATKASSKVTKAGGKTAWIVAAPLALATGSAYMAKKPNQDEVEAAKDLIPIMQDSQADLQDAQDAMAEATEESQTRADEAQETQEGAAETIEEDKTIFDAYRTSYNKLKARAEGGEKLTEDEKAQMHNFQGLMKTRAKNIGTTKDEASETVQGLQEEITEYQDVFDDSVETIAEVEGITDYAEGFDSATKTMCIVEGVGQGLNAVSGGQAAWQAGAFAASGGIFTAWAWGFAAAGAAGAAMSAYGVKEQTLDYLPQVNEEIGLRNMTQDLGEMSNDIYDESIDVYDGTLDIVEESLEVEKPNDLAIPKDTANVDKEDKSAKDIETKKGSTKPEEAKLKNQDEKDKKNIKKQ